MTQCLDLAFVMDCTASMGEYIEAARQNIKRIVESISSEGSYSVRLALVEYRDHPETYCETTYVTRSRGFTSNVAQMKRWLNDASAGPGGDWPEAVADGLYDAVQLDWDSEIRMCVLVSDAPPHGLPGDRTFPNGCPKGLDPIVLCNRLAEKGVTLYAVGCEPALCPHKDIFMAFALITGGLYVPLNDATLLAKVIIGGAKEEVSIRKLMVDVDNVVRSQFATHGVVDEETTCKELMQIFQEKGSKTKQLQMNEGALPKASGRAKRYARFPTLADIKPMFVKTSRNASIVKHSSYQVVDQAVDILQIQRMVQKSVMVNRCYNPA